MKNLLVKVIWSVGQLVIAITLWLVNKVTMRLQL